MDRQEHRPFARRFAARRLMGWGLVMGLAMASTGCVYVMNEFVTLERTRPAPADLRFAPVAGAEERPGTVRRP